MNVGDAVELSSKAFSEMSPEIRAFWRSILGAPVFDLIDSWKPDAKANGTWVVTSVSTSSFTIVPTTRA